MGHHEDIFIANALYFQHLSPRDAKLTKGCNGTLEHSINEYNPCDEFTVSDDAKCVPVPTNRVDATILEYIAICGAAMRTPLLLSQACQHSEVSTRDLMAARIDQLTGRKSVLTAVSDPQDWVDLCCQTESTVFVDPDDVKCSATGSRQSMLPIFLLRPGPCAIKGCFQPHNGSGHGRCQIHETRHIQAQYGEQGASEDMRPLLSVDTEVWMRELRTSERFDRIAEGPAVWKPKYKGARTRIPMTRSEPKGKGKGL